MDFVRNLIRIGGALFAVFGALPADASFYSAEADVVFFNQATFTNTNGGNVHASANTGRQAAADGQRVSRADASSDEGQLYGEAASDSGGRKITGVFIASATYDDLTFTGTGLPPGTLLSVTLHYNVSVTQAASGSLGSSPGFNSRQLTYSVNFNGTGETGSITFDVGGSSGTALVGPHTLTSAALIPIDTPVTISVSINGGAQATLGAVGPPAQTSIQAALSVGAQTAAIPSMLRGASAAASATSDVVFDLPPGVTANSVSMGVVDNHWVPEPSGTPMLSGGLTLLVVLARRRADRSAARR